MTGNEPRLSSNKKGSFAIVKAEYATNTKWSGNSCFHGVQREYEGSSGVRQRFL